MKKTKLIVGLCLSTCMSFAQWTNPFTGGAALFAGNATGPNGTQGVTTSGAAAIGNDLSRTQGIVVNKLGETYIADWSNNVVLKVDAWGVMTIIAGTGIASYGGDGGPATNAQLNKPSTLALDVQGNLYINDWGNGIIRKITAYLGTINRGTSHTINTIAGTPPALLPNGMLEVFHCSGGTTCGDGGPALSATFYDPTGIAVDGNGNLFIVDSDVIREVLSPTSTKFYFQSATYQPGTIKTISGEGYLGNGPYGNGYPAANANFDFGNNCGIAFDATYSNLYVNDGSETRRIDITGSTPGIIYGFAGSAITSGTTPDGYPQFNVNGFTSNAAITVDANNNVYVSLDENGGGIVMFSPTLAGGYGTVFNTIQTGGLATDACGNLYFNNESGVIVEKALNGTAATFKPQVTVPIAVCSGSTINVTGMSGSSSSIIYPDSYTWNLIPTYANGSSSGIGGVTATITNPTSNSTSYSFPTAQLPCSTYCIVELTVTKKCPIASTVTYTSPVIFINCNPAPVITGNTSVCSSGGKVGSTTLTENLSGSPYSIFWNEPGIIIRGGISTNASITESPISNTQYEVTVTNTVTGCSGMASQLVTVQNIQPEFTLSSVLSSSSDHFYNITASNYTYLSSSVDPTFKLNWTIMEVPVGSTGPTYSPVLPNTSEVASCIYWNNLAGGAANSFQGYNTNLNAPYNSYGIGTTLPATSASPVGIFRTGHQYAVTLATSSSTCPNVTPLTLTTYQSCSGCRTEDIENQTESQPALSIYPNPNNGNFTLETTETAQQSVEVYDLTGRLVLTQTITGTATINAASLPDGIYNVKISGTNGAVNKRLVIAK